MSLLTKRELWLMNTAFEMGRVSNHLNRERKPLNVDAPADCKEWLDSIRSVNGQRGLKKTGDWIAQHAPAFEIPAELAEQMESKGYGTSSPNGTEDDKPRYGTPPNIPGAPGTF